MLTIINDTHIGVQRSAGTTPRSAQALAEFVHAAFEDLVGRAEGDVCVLGDLFDQYIVPNTDLLLCYNVLASWCRKHPDRELHLVAGNHDLSKDNSRLSSFELVSQLLLQQFSNVRVYLTPGWLANTSQDRHWVIPHLRNQDIFNMALQEVPEDAQVILLHANYDNAFAEQADHSLNVSKEQAQALVSRGARLVFAHEHQTRVELGGAVVIPGNQIPTSIADCLGTSTKSFATVAGAKVLLQPYAEIVDLFEQLDWRELSAPPPGDDTKFIRVVGEASAQEAADVISKISKYRQRSAALVITNAVSIEGVQALEDLPATLEAAKGFDTLSAILETLTPAEQAVVRKLIGEEDATTT